MSERTESQPPWEMALSWCPPADSPLLAATSGNTQEGPGDSEQAAVTHRYNRIAWAYDYFNAPMEWAGMGKRRRRLLTHAKGAVLEVGVGTGRNIRHYPEGTHLVAIDASTSMLSRARRRAEGSRRSVEFGVADVTNLPYSDDSFDTAVATSVFCSVAEPIAGLRELGRVTEPGGRILLIEHVRPRGRFFGLVADVMTSVTRRLFGFRLNRRTEQAIVAAGLRIASIRREGIWREIIADPPTRPQGSEDSQ